MTEGRKATASRQPNLGAKGRPLCLQRVKNAGLKVGGLGDMRGNCAAGRVSHGGPAEATRIFPHRFRLTNLWIGGIQFSSAS